MTHPLAHKRGWSPCGAELTPHVRWYDAVAGHVRLVGRLAIAEGNLTPGGGAASSMLQGENAAELDFNAVQRGDAEMEQKMNRVIRA